MFEDEFPFPKVGYVSFLEGTTPKISQFRSIINHHTWCNPHIIYTLFCLSTRFYHHVVWDSKIWGARKFMEIWSLLYIYKLIFRFHWLVICQVVQVIQTSLSEVLRHPHPSRDLLQLMLGWIRLEVAPCWWLKSSWGNGSWNLPLFTRFYLYIPGV